MRDSHFMAVLPDLCMLNSNQRLPFLLICRLTASSCLYVHTLWCICLIYRCYSFLGCIRHIFASNFMCPHCIDWGQLLYGYMFITPAQRSWRGYTGFALAICPDIWMSICPSLHLSVHPSVCLWTESCPRYIFHNTVWIYFIFTHLITEFQKVCHALDFLKIHTFEILANSLNL